MPSGEITIRKIIDAASRIDGETSAQGAHALSLAAGKAARGLFDVEASLHDASQTESGKSELLENAPDPGLLFVLTAADGARGLLSLDGLLVNALVEVMTGAADNSVFKEQRVPTRTDVALCRDFCTHLLDFFPAEMAVAGVADFPTFRLHQHETQAAKLTYALDDLRYCCIGGQVRLQNGIRGGGLVLALPYSAWNARPRTGRAGSDAWSGRLAENVLGARLVLRANLATMSVSLADAFALKVGDELPVAARALSEIDLIIDGGAPLLRGRLGQMNGRKAISVATGSAAKPAFANAAQTATRLPASDNGATAAALPPEADQVADTPPESHGEPAPMPD